MDDKKTKVVEEIINESHGISISGIRKKSGMEYYQVRLAMKNLENEGKITSRKIGNLVLVTPIDDARNSR